MNNDEKQPSTKYRPRVASFFAGAGGLDIGFSDAGFDIVMATDFDADCCETLKLNEGRSVGTGGKVLKADIREISSNELPENIDLVIGGPPCQSFSASGRRAGGAAGSLDARGTLFRAYKDCIAHMQPKAFLFENVRGIFATNKGQDWSDIVASFRAIGYTLSHRVLDAADYGAPQHRERVFLVGLKDGKEFQFPAPTHGPDSTSGRPHVSPLEAFSSIKHTKEDLAKTAFSGGKYSHLLAEVPEGDNYLYFTQKRGYPSPIFAYRSRFSDFLYKSSPHQPMKTIIASPGKYTGPLHWDNRYFSLPEYKAIQGFPDDYQFYGERASIVKQIGNSVSPHIAFRLAKSIMMQIFGGEAIETLQPSQQLSFDRRKGAKAARTRAFHQEVEAKSTTKVLFALGPYKSHVGPSKLANNKPNCIAKVSGKHVSIEVHHDNSKQKFCQFTVAFWQKARSFSHDPVALVTVKAFGEPDETIQTAWNAIDQWIIQSSAYHSLFEAYGHFTEPYPIFKVLEFLPHSDRPILAFAQLITDFSYCSRYMDRKELQELLGRSFGTNDEGTTIERLRQMRFDIRTRETNIAIPAGKYMIAYPFTLPSRKQMNIKMRLAGDESAQSYITEYRR